MAVNRGIVIDLMRMNRIVEIDEGGYRVTVEPGANILAIDDALRKKGMTLGFDPGSGPVVSIGGLP
jgi:FAD/FMN-containing dehydrogenase